MGQSEIESVLANWIERALSPVGHLPPGIDPAAWISCRFAEWWKVRAEGALIDAERAASVIRSELMRSGGWELFGEALHEQIHLQDALANLRGILGFQTD